MNRYIVENLFGLPWLNVTWYGAIIGSGLVLGLILASWQAKRRGYKSDLIFDFLLIAIPVAIICARLYYVVFEWDYFSKVPSEIIAIWHGGLAIYGGVIGGFLVGVFFTRHNKFPLWELIDIVTPSLILGQAIGRWGNFVNQEAFGNLITNPSLQFFPYGVYIEQLAEWHQATFFYESMWSLLVFAFLMLYRKKAAYNGDIFARYLIGYGIGRFFIEGLRTDSLYVFEVIRVSQMLSLILIAVGIVMIAIRKKRPKDAPVYEGKYRL